MEKWASINEEADFFHPPTYPHHYQLLLFLPIMRIVKLVFA
jgi:hypothetical protein